MKFISLVNRVAPFFLTFAVGLFIASFFVTVAAPNFQFRRGFNRHRQMDRQMQMENQQLREENNRLKNRLAEAEKRDWVLESDLDVPPPPPVPPTMPMKTVPYKSR
ncbi:MAG TPA: hypothetical protein VNB22_06065 [Pyrinomonadaceae bacterium]|nr:hypothetical protein [Pyrinomonadaceae bacterium]